MKSGRGKCAGLPAGLAGLGSLALVSFTLCAQATFASALSDHAEEFRHQLIERVLPYWHDTAQDKDRGGYLLADDLKGRGEAREKQLVSQTRMIWGFAHAHLHKLGDGQRDYLEAARQGYRFLLDHFRDREHGGYYWKTDLAGVPIHSCKFLYGESFVIYALVEYYRASGDRSALQHALTLYRDIQRHMHDAEQGGWIEHTEADWRPLAPGDPRNEVEVVGYKSANAHLHWMEALAELCQASRDPDVQRSLEEALRINREYFYPKQPGASCFHRQADWQPVTAPSSAGLSYGHNVEFAWLMLRAETVLGRSLSWDHFDAHLDHALRYGYDHEQGGLFYRGSEDQPASDTTKVWWAEAEMLAALTDALRRGPNPRIEKALEQLVHFLIEHQIDSRDGIWLDTLRADGTPLRTGKAHNWKANYHDVRALVKFVEGCSSRFSPVMIRAPRL
jgi:mannobiose 2-epimerase